MAATDALAKMVVTISANTADFARAMQDTSNRLSSFSSAVGQIGGALGVAFSVQQVAGFVKEVSVLAGQVQGVKAAFDRLQDSQKVMQDLKTATGGTVSELELMKAAVQANNFQIPVQQLANLFKFATLRAQQTGQSVDYLVQSIVTGIGRKSPLILDNLGISAVRLREKLKGVGTEAATVGDVAKVVGDIATEELGNMAGFSENAATKMQRLNATWEDLKATIGEVANGKNGDGFFSAIVDGLNTWIGLLKKDPSRDFGLAMLDLARKIKVENAPAIKGLTEDLKKLNAEFGVTANDTQIINIAKALKLSDEQAARFFQTMRSINGVIKATPAPFSGETTKNDQTLDALEQKLKALNDEFQNLNITNTEGLALKGKEIIALDAQIKKINELRKAQGDVATGLLAVRNRLAEITKQLESTSLNDEQRLNSLRQQKQALEQLISAQERLNKKRNEEILIQTRLDSAIAQSEFLKLANENKLPSLFSFKEDDMQRIISAIKTVKNELRTFADTSIEIGGIVSGAIVDMANAFGSLTQKSTNFGQAILEVAAGFAQQFGSILIAAGVAKISFDKFSGPAMIVAGAALVALGAAAKGIIANRPNLSTASSGGGATSNSASFSSQANTGLISLIAEGEWRISGRDLVFVYDKNKGLDGSRRG